MPSRRRERFPHMNDDRSEHGDRLLPGAVRLDGRDLHDARLLVRDVICTLADEWTSVGVAGPWFAAFDRAARLQEALGTVEAPLEPVGALPPELGEALVEFAADEVRQAWRRLGGAMDDAVERATVEEREGRASRVLSAVTDPAR